MYFSIQTTHTGNIFPFKKFTWSNKRKSTSSVDETPWICEWTKNNLNQKAQIINEINFQKRASKSVTFCHIHSTFEVNFCFPVSLAGIYISDDLSASSIISLNSIRNQASAFLFAQGFFFCLLVVLGFFNYFYHFHHFHDFLSWHNLALEGKW